MTNVSENSDDILRLASAVASSSSPAASGTQLSALRPVSVSALRPVATTGSGAEGVKCEGEEAEEDSSFSSTVGGVGVGAGVEGGAAGSGIVGKGILRGKTMPNGMQPSAPSVPSIKRHGIRKVCFIV